MRLLTYCLIIVVFVTTFVVDSAMAAVNPPRLTADIDLTEENDSVRTAVNPLRLTTDSSLTARSDSTASSVEAPFRLGYSLFNPTYVTSPLDCGQIQTLDLFRRNLLNIENSGDLIASDIRFYHPDLVIDGRDVSLSAFGKGSSGTRLMWRNRPLRNPRTLRADFNRIAPLFIGGVRSVGFGALAGIVGTAGVVEFSPVRSFFDEPLTALHHRDGYYGYAPVEFIHKRRVGLDTYVTAGANFPASDGRYENSKHTGQTVFGEMFHKLNTKSSLTAVVMNRKDKTGIAFTDKKRSYNDNDWDVNYTLKLNNLTKLQTFGYRTWRVEKEEKFHTYSREGGVGFRVERIIKPPCHSRCQVSAPDSMSDSRCQVSVPDSMCENAGNTVKYNDLTAGGGTIGLHFRTSWIDIDLPEESKLHLTECEGSISGKYNLGPVTLSSMIGGYGWYPDRIGLTAAAGIETYLSKIGAFYGSFIQAVNPHSPEEMYAGYRENRPVDDLQPLWRLREELPVKGAILPVSGSMGGEIGFKSMFGITEEFDRLSPARVLTIDLAVFQRRDKNPIYWTIEGDSIIAPKTAHDRTTVGWRGALHWHQNPFRASLKMIGMDREDLPERGVPVMIAEPTFRLMWELGWRQRYWGDDFEADVSLGGHYYNSFYSFADEAEWIKLGNAYPLDMKLSVRIRRFTLYWGMHNWNAYPYYLVPDYKMMHKEEYWGIHWLLID